MNIPLFRSGKTLILTLILALGVGVTSGFAYHRLSGNERPLGPAMTQRPDTAEVLVTPEPSQTVSLIAVGDIMLSRGVAEKIVAHKDPNYPFLKVADFLRSADITFANLETSITPGRPIRSGEFTFRAEPTVAKAMFDAGIDIVSLANNHTPNFGTKGLEDTFRYLNEAGILHTGAGKNTDAAHRPAIITKNGITFAFLAFNDNDVVPASYEATATRAGTAFMRIEPMKTAVASANKQADIVVVSMHSGIEYAAQANQRQKTFAHAAIDAGADVVIGHHPHVVQPVERYKEKYIFYSLGNFIFDQRHSLDVKQGLAVQLVLDKEGVTDVSYQAIQIEDFSQPRLLTGPGANRVLARLK